MFEFWFFFILLYLLYMYIFVFFFLEFIKKEDKEYVLDVKLVLLILGKIYKFFVEFFLCF